jgi:uncharacterized protein (TIGR00730 family)
LHFILYSLIIMLIAVFCASSVPNNPKYVSAATELGTKIAHQGHTLVYGGSNLGTMGDVSGAALAAGGEVIGVIPSFFSDEIIHSQPVTKLLKVASMAERKEWMIHNCDAFIALPGGIGTLDEILEVMVANQLKLIKEKPIVIYNPDGFFDHLVQQIETMGQNGFFRSGRRPALRMATTIDELLHHCGA